MRRLKRNQREFTYFLYTGMEDELDTQGFRTGRKIETYADGITIGGCIVYRGTSNYKPYGVEEDFSVCIIPDHKIPVDTKTKIVIDNETYYVKSCPITMNEQRIYVK